ncbi:MAG: Lrp/AsnC ligand binding domain-containing protein [Promethearchaeota archaeon]
MSSKEKVLAFVLLITDSIQTQEIYKELQGYGNVKEAHMIYGDYDLILKIELQNLAEMTSFMMDLRKRFAIKKSSTLIALAE